MFAVLVTRFSLRSELVTSLDWASTPTVRHFGPRSIIQFSACMCVPFLIHTYVSPCRFVSHLLLPKKGKKVRLPRAVRMRGTRCEDEQLRIPPQSFRKACMAWHGMALHLRRGSHRTDLHHLKPYACVYPRQGLAPATPAHEPAANEILLYWCDSHHPAWLNLRNPAYRGFLPTMLATAAASAVRVLKFVSQACFARGSSCVIP